MKGRKEIIENITEILQKLDKTELKAIYMALHRFKRSKSLYT